MSRFSDYLASLLAHERTKTEQELGAREQLIVHSGRGLNWLGDYFGNPELAWELREIPIDNIRFTGSSPAWNAILKEQCQCLPSMLRELVARQPEIGERLRSETTHVDDTPVAVRRGDEPDTWKVLDGMHRAVRNVLDGRTTIAAWVPTNEGVSLPHCEPHVVYDLIRGMQRHAHDDAGATDLTAALRLLLRTYANVDELLRTRFDRSHVDDDLVQRAIADARISP